MSIRLAVLTVTILTLAACGTVPHRKAAPPAPSSGGYLPGDGPGANIPANLDSIPDAVPRVEPLHPYANRPYIALGKTYRPITTIGNFKQRGMASWYGKKFNGEKTSSGEKYDMYAMTAAHPTLPLPSYARVTNLANQKSVVVRINDRGPFMNDRIIDLSYTAAYKLGIINDGSAEVEVESINPNVIVKTITASTVQSHPLDSHASAPATVPAVNTTPAGPAANTAETPVAVVTPAAPAPAAATAPVPSPAVPAVPPAPAIAPVPEPAQEIASASPTAPAPLASLKISDSAIYLQLGAFSSLAGAEAYRDKLRLKLGDLGDKQLKLTTQDGLVRVHVGPYANQSEARLSADAMESKLGFKPMVNLP